MSAASSVNRRSARRAQLTEGPVAATLARLTGPMMVGIVSMMAFGLVDTFFVGHLDDGANALAAMGFAFPVVFIISSVALGLGVGASAVISRAIGEGNEAGVRRLTTDSLVLSVAIVAALSALGMLTVRPLFGALGASGVILDHVGQYMHIWYLGMVFVVVPMVGNNAIRATGDTVTPSVVMVVAVLVNGVLDPLLIFGYGPFPRLEIAGAALATVFARMTTFAVSLAVLHFRDHMLSLRLPALSEMAASWRRVLSVGIPVAGSNVIGPMGMAIVTRILALHGPDAVAGFAVAGRLEGFSLTLFIALSTVLGPFVGQNYGAGTHGRIREALRVSHLFALAWGGVLFVVLLAFGQRLAAVFNDTPAVVQTAALYLTLVPVTYGMRGVQLLSCAALNVLNHSRQSALVTGFQVFGVWVPLAMLGSHLAGVRGIFLAGAAGNVLAGALAWVLLRDVVAQERL